MRSMSSLPSLLRLPLAGLPLALAFLSFGLQDDEGKKAPPTDGPQLERDVFGRLRPQAKGEDSALEGAWQLLDMEVEGYPDLGRQTLGFMLIQDGHLSLQLEAYWEEDDFGDAPEDGYQAFVAEFIRTGNTLACSTLMGAYIDEEEGDVAFEDPGGKRNFEISVNGAFLDLNWGEGQVLTFARRVSPNQKRLSIYGKEIPGTPDGDPDIFGRDAKKGDKEGDDDGKP